MSKYHRKSRPSEGDEFVSFWARLFEKVSPYLNGLSIFLAVTLVLTSVGWGIANWLDGKAQGATEQFGRALHIYAADLSGENSIKPEREEQNPVPRFKTTQERADATLAALDELDRNFPHSRIRKESPLFRAGIYFDLGKYAEALSQYQSFVAQSGLGDGAEVPVAREGIGLALEAQGKLDEALASYKAIAEVPADPKARVGYYFDRALAAQARVLLRKGDKKHAAELLKAVLSKVPTTPLKDDIETQLAQIDAT